MKILKHGKHPVAKKLRYKIKCPFCGCVFVVEDNEIEVREKRLNGDCTIHCPECEELVIFKREGHVYDK